MPRHTKKPWPWLSPSAAAEYTPQYERIGIAERLPLMTETWKKRCLIDEEERPTQRRAWKQGWMYRKEHGPGDPHWYAPRSLTGTPELLSAWVEGFEAADKYLSAPGPESSVD